MKSVETIALNISDIDIKGNTIFVSKILTYDENHKHYIHDSALFKTKNNYRLVKINDIFRNNLIEAMINTKSNKYNKEKLVFCQDNGSLILESSLNSYFKNV